jgi:hypothetical protein
MATSTIDTGAAGGKRDDEREPPEQLLWQYSASLESMHKVAEMAASRGQDNVELECALYLIASEAGRLQRAIGEVAWSIQKEKPEPANGEPLPADFIVPRIIGKRRPDTDEWTHDAMMAAGKHAKHLRKAEDRLAKAKGLAETLRCALRSDDYDPEPFADDIAASIVGLLGKAQTQIDRHSTDHSNLFLAYFEKERASDVPATD